MRGVPCSGDRPSMKLSPHRRPRDSKHASGAPRWSCGNTFPDDRRARRRPHAVEVGQRQTGVPDDLLARNRVGFTTGRNVRPGG